jgi:hypothetical protein
MRIMNSRFDGSDFGVDGFAGEGLGIEVCVDDLC